MSVGESRAVAEPGASDMILSRVFDAPRDLVFDAWTDPEKVAKWYGPNGFSMTLEKMDVRPGGEWIFVLHGPDGAEYPNHSTYTAVDRPRLIACSHGGGRKGSVDATFHMTATFVQVNRNQTLLTMRMVFTSPEVREAVVSQYGALEGGKQTLNRLAGFVEQKEVLARAEQLQEQHPPQHSS